mgnify:CR=1 FL=1
MKKCILLSCNADHLKYAEFVAWQIRQKTNSQTPIFIASADPNAMKLVGTDSQLILFDSSDFLKNLPQNDRLKQFAYWRIPAIELLSDNFDRILYLDTDVIITGENLDSIFSINMQNATVGAVRDVYQSTRPNRYPREFNALGLPNAPYFNAGVLLIDGKAWKGKGIYNKIKKVAQNNPEAITALDQSLLNLAVYCDWLEISPVWNWQLSERNWKTMLQTSVEICHIAGPNKAWSENNATSLPINFARSQFLQFCQAVEIDGSNQGADPKNKLNKLFLIKISLKNWVYKHHYKKWLARFTSKFIGNKVKPFTK